MPGQNHLSVLAAQSGRVLGFRISLKYFSDFLPEFLSRSHHTRIPPGGGVALGGAFYCVSSCEVNDSLGLGLLHEDGGRKTLLETGS